jgi:hypothetical protein
VAGFAVALSVLSMVYGLWSMAFDTIVLAATT